ncbi:MAG: glycosyltransferase, partial [Candidatus Muiribacteriota bacterium]
FEIKKQSIQNSNFEVIVASKWMKEKVSQSPIFKGKKINIIPFGINQKVFKPINKDNVKKELGIPNDSFIITFRCDYSGFKGMDYIDYVLKNIKTKKNIYILAVANTYNIKIKNITCINFGWVKDNSLLSKIYGITDLFLAPSSADSFGMMVVEIMSCGVLPIVLEGTALPETVNSPECGVSTKRIKKEYFKVVQYYIEHDEERNERSKKCLEFAKKNYNKDLYLNKIIKVYKEAIKNHNTTEDDKHLLSQLKKYMMVGSFKPIFKKPENKIKRFKKIKMMIRKIVIICFYKVDKFFPKKIRKKMKTKLVKFNFVRKYLIK